MTIPMTDVPDYIHKEIQGLREHVDDRIHGIEDSIRKLVDFQGKVVEYIQNQKVVEHRVENVESQVADMQKREDATREHLESLRRSLTRLSAYAAAAAFLLTVFGPVLVQFLLRYFNV